MHTLFEVHPRAGVRATAGICMLVLAAAVSLTAQQQAPPAAPPAPPPPKPLIAKSPDGTRIAYEVTGTGPALLLLHGGGQTRRSWNERGYVEPLSKQFTVITVDLRGNGDSDKPRGADAYALDRVLADLLAVADAAKAPRFVLWGFGHGATIGRYLAARSDRVIASVLVGATMGPPVVGIVKDAIVGMREKWMPLVLAQQKGALDLKPLSDGDRAAWANGVAVNAVSLGSLVDYPALEPSEIKVPTLWLVGATDDDSRKNAAEYEGKLQGTKVTFAELEGMSYSDSFSRSEQVLAKVRPFLAANR
jgi:pimeloyl-ACP methyl ester carboxylesterase